MYLIHWPAAPHQFENWQEINNETWRAMEELYRAGKIKAIGVCNFKQHHLEPLLEKAEIMPMVNQIEFHPGFTQFETIEYCQKNGIHIEGWSHLGTGSVLKNETLLKIADKYGKSTAQICIRWGLQHGVLPLPKSLTESRIKENSQVFDFEITEEDMKKIDEIEFCGGMAFDPDEVDF